jgi:ferric-dicitrate binding protein FerR (iron transport regulator)
MENYIKIIYKKFLYGTIRKEEFLEMRHELNKSDLPELTNLFSEEWNEDMNPEVMTEKDKEIIRSKLNFYVEFDKKRLFRKRMIQIAAVLIPFVFILYAVLYINQPSTETEKDFVVTVKHGDRAQVTLPDQSKVWMNSNSKLVYRNGKNNTREVQLTGEAFFKVYKDKIRPFIVSTSVIQVEVLGTSFNLNARQGSDVVETSLVEGSIKLSGAELSQDYLLKPNEKAIYTTSTKSIKIVPTDNEVETAWKDNKLQFRSEKFGSVVKRMEEWYGVKIISNCPNIEHDLISGAFKGESLETVLESFSIQYKIKYKIQGDSVVVLYN